MVKRDKPELSTDKLVVNDLMRALKFAVGERDVTLAHISLSWDGATWPFRHPLDYVGSEGGGGVGGGPGNTVGTALALKGSGRLAGRGLRRRRLHDGQHRASGPRCITRFRC